MKCPVCAHELKPFDAGQFNVDICCDGCSGIWLDASEFDRCDEYTEPFPNELLNVRRAPNVLIDRSRERSCPKCGPKQVMGRHALDADSRFEIDSCGACNGIWLDVGELAHLRKESKEIADRQAKLAEWQRQTEAQVESVRARFGVKALLTRIFSC